MLLRVWGPLSYVPISLLTHCAHIPHWAWSDLRILYIHVRLFHHVHVHVGVGTRNYHRKIGYELDGPYMSKLLHVLWYMYDVITPHMITQLLWSMPHIMQCMQAWKSMCNIEMQNVYNHMFIHFDDHSPILWPLHTRKAKLSVGMELQILVQFGRQWTCSLWAGMVPVYTCIGHSLDAPHIVDVPDTCTIYTTQSVRSSPLH